MKFIRTDNMEIVRQIVNDPSILPFVTDDLGPEEFRPTHEPVLYLLVYDQAELLGCFALIPRNAATWELHTCLLPNGRGARALRAVKELLEWIWANTPCQRLVTECPENNPRAKWAAIQSGLSLYGMNPKSFLKDGKLLDTFELGISRPENF